jgi:hypothetical protein
VQPRHDQRRDRQNDQQQQRYPCSLDGAGYGTGIWSSHLTAFR